MASHLFLQLNLVATNIIRIFTFSFKTAMAKSNSSEDVALLASRLFSAEKKLKVLQNEINDIKAKIAAIQKNNGLETLKDEDDPFLMFLKSEDSKINISNKRLTNDSVDNKFNNDCYNPNKKLKIDFNVEDDYIVVYTDGACENNGKTNAKAGIGVWFGENHTLNVSKPVQGRPTNNTAEIQACISAVNTAHANGIKKLKIKTDSQFVINSITQWIHKWKKNNWKVASGGDVKNKEDFETLDQCLRKLDSVKWEHINGHCGIRGNEEADRLARLGALEYKAVK